MTSALLKRLAATVALLVCSATPLAAQGLGAPPSFRSVSRRTPRRLVAGQPFRLALVATIASGWHVNSNKPSEDYLIPTEAALVPLEGLSFGVPVYPAHREKKLPFSDKPLALFDGEVVIVVQGTARADASPGPGPSAPPSLSSLATTPSASPRRRPRRCSRSTSLRQGRSSPRRTPRSSRSPALAARRAPPRQPGQPRPPRPPTRARSPGARFPPSSASSSSPGSRST